MSAGLHPGKSATATIHPNKQNRESVHRIVDHILAMGGCDGCGRLALLNIHFLSDPPPDFGKEGVISLETQGF